MSGGFFRGTSADQDTRFSNKQAKLLKSQKFAPELEHLVDMTKVSMDVIRPWIANRVTELLGFEDEVLINFIYGLLDGKVVNGKEVQISLTGFMEKNTGKFMKELWALLISAQKNTSGVPQQFLDAKQEETRKKKEEADRIANEIQRKRDKESRELEEERLKKMDGRVEMKANNDALEPKSEHKLQRASSDLSEDAKETDKRNGVKSRNKISRSPHSAGRSSLSPKGSPSRSISKSYSNTRSYSGERNRSKSASRSPEARGRSVSSERVYFSSRRRSVTPRRRHSPRRSISPIRGRPSNFRRRSRSSSPSRRRLVSPYRRRSPSPVRRRSPSPVRRRRSPSPLRRRRSPSPSRRRRSPLLVRHRASRSPMRRRRSPSPIRRRRSPSPLRRRRSPSPVRRRRSPSPLRRRRSPSPVRRHISPSIVRRRMSPSPDRRRVSPSPIRRRLSPSPVQRLMSPSPSPVGGMSPSPSPVRRRVSPSPVRRRVSPSPVRRRVSPSPVRRRVSPSPVRRRVSPSPVRRRVSPSPVRRRVSPSPILRRVSPSPIRRRVSPSPVQRQGQRSPSSPPQRYESPVQRRSPVGGRRSTPSRSRSVSPYARSSSSPTQHGSPSPIRRKSPKHQTSLVQASSRERIRTQEKLSPIARRSSSEEGSPYKSPLKQPRDEITYDANSSPARKPREQKLHRNSTEISEENDGDQKPIALDKRLKSSSTNSRQKDSPAKVHYREDYSPERLAGHKTTENRSHQDDMVVRIKDHDIAREKRGISDQQKSPTVYRDSLPDERQQTSYPGEDRKFNEKNRSRSNNSQQHKLESVDTFVEKIDHKNRSGTSGSEESDKHKTGDKGKRKHKRSERQEPASDDYSYESEIDVRKEAKRRRKEEKKLRKEEKRRRREERRRRRDERRAEKRKGKIQSDFSASDGENDTRKESHQNENEETESEQKKLEIELRNKALQSLKAKKGFSH